jgi:hypothetical protein
VARPWPGIRCATALLVLAASASCQSTATPLPTSRTTPQPGGSVSSTFPPGSVQPTMAGAPGAECGAGVPMRAAEHHDGSAAAAYAEDDAVLLYDIQADTSRRVSVAEPSLSGLRPQFRDSHRVTLLELRTQPDADHTFGQDSLVEVDLESGRSTEFLRLPTSVLGYEWDPTGALLAYQVRVEAGGELRPVVLCLFDSRTGLTSGLRTLSEPILTGTDQRQETSVSWSRLGDRIAVVDTLERLSIVVTDLEGRDVIAPRGGTFARWLTNDTLLYSQTSSPEPNSWAWFSMAVGADTATALDLPAEMHRPTLSPDGQLLAFDDGKGAHPAMSVVDLGTGAIRRLGVGLVGPIWLQPRLLAGSVTGACEGTEFCQRPWTLVGGTIAVDLSATDATMALGLPTTLSRSVRYGAIDVWLGN